MPVDQWFERWADAQIKEIEKVDSDAKERCADLSKTLREVENDLINVTATVQQLRASLDAINEDFDATSVQFTDMIRKNSDDILKHGVACPHPKAWELVWNRIAALEKSEHKREGSGKWEMIFINALISIFVAITIAITLYFMSGGRIAS